MINLYIFKGIKLTDVAKMTGDLWRKLSDDEKQVCGNMSALVLMCLQVGSYKFGNSMTVTSKNWLYD